MKKKFVKPEVKAHEVGTLMITVISKETADSDGNRQQAKGNFTDNSFNW